MKGRILGFTPATGQGAITTDDGSRHDFAIGEWRSDLPITVGASVDFEARDGAATAIYPVMPAASPGIDFAAVAASPGARRLQALLTGTLAFPLALLVLLACMMPAITSPLQNVSLFDLGSAVMALGAFAELGGSDKGLSFLLGLLWLRWLAPIAAIWLLWVTWQGGNIRLASLVAGASAIFAFGLFFLLKQGAVAVGGEYLGAVIGFGFGAWLLLAAGIALILAAFGKIRNPLATA